MLQAVHRAGVVTVRGLTHCMCCLDVLPDNATTLYSTREAPLHLVCSRSVPEVCSGPLWGLNCLCGRPCHGLHVASCSR